MSIDEQLDILRRIAERGKADAEKNNINPDNWIHMLDEIERLKLLYNYVD
jgi:hypothetical protein